MNEAGALALAPAPFFFAVARSSPGPDLAALDRAVRAGIFGSTAGGEMVKDRGHGLAVGELLPQPARGHVEDACQAVDASFSSAGDGSGG